MIKYDPLIALRRVALATAAIVILALVKKFVGLDVDAHIQTLVAAVAGAVAADFDAFRGAKDAEENN